MASNAWPGADGSSHQSTNVSPATQRVLDAQLIKQLIGRYGPDELSRIIQETSTTPSDGASIMSSAQSSILSDESSVWDTQSIRTFSDTSSITGSIISNVSRGTSKILGRRSQSSSASAAAQAQAAQQAVQTQQDQQSWNGSESTLDAASGTSGASKQKGAFMCGFCKEEDITKTCTRKNDLKRHIEDFHNVNAQWFCRHRGCQMVFDWQGAYKTHLKQAHGGSRMSLDEAKVNLCPQVVFACGFDNCLQVFEAQGDSDASSTFKEYVSHVVKHFDEGANSGEWSYSARIRNLLRQSQVQSAWNESMWSEASRTSLQWSPQSSGILRKRLECRHIGDLKLLIQYAFLLGTDPSSVGKFREDFITPVADTCTMHMPGHKSRQQSTMAPPEPADPFSFKISRGANPQLAAYMASQRRVYVQRQQRVARPAQLHHPHQQVPTSGAMASQSRLSHSSQSSHHSQSHQHNGQNHSTLGHFFQTMPDAQMYDPNAGNQPFANGMQHNGIIADDMQSLRSMAGGPQESADVEMQDPGMMTDFSSSYVPHANLTSPSMSGHPDGFFPPGQAY
ncbi:homeobox and c2h2 transcription [Colletotrichum karsti]|uniref:Homeobox and c2h2 transcription n=1 Tax=Colletotrichum karsti TaxID=1095194 RepID=A0A9P6I5K1_9PEZI|nr:homeobox and c2h2 transcription [Colletotrichum karsti]KAF9876649.1 homeobox and c2h2 transcription [Colletotrichum karsti]